ncbi:hypothetical protein LTR95_011253 [Oleoguttula sp. CCFEE 5521]
MSTQIDSVKSYRQLTVEEKVQRPVYRMTEDFASSPETLDWLLDRGVDINRTDHKRDEQGIMLYGPVNHSVKVLDNIAAAGDVRLFDHMVSRGADPSRSLALHAATRCQDAGLTITMIDYLIDQHHMSLEGNSESLRDYMHSEPGAGTPIHSAIANGNLAALQHLVKRGADMSRPAFRSITNLAIGEMGPQEGFLPALGPLLDAGADMDTAVWYPSIRNNVEAHKICHDRGGDLEEALQQVDALDARRRAGELQSDEEQFEIDENDDEAVQRRAETGRYLRSFRSER